MEEQVEIRGTPSTRKYACTQAGCTQQYARIEHLERHLRAHSGANYECTECHKSFQRSDVLRRHKKIHQRAEEEGKQPRRALKACQACSSSKLKCDGQQPCSRCQSANASCVYEGPSAPKRLRVQTPLEASSSSTKVDEPSLDIPTEFFHPEQPFTNQHTLTLPPQPGVVPWESNAAQLCFAAELDSAMFGASHAQQPVDSGTMLDSVLNLAFDQPHMTSLEEHLVSAFALPSDESLFWNQFMASPDIFAPPPQPDKRLEQPYFPQPPPRAGPVSKRPQILITAQGLFSRPASRPASRQGSPPSAEEDEVAPPAPVPTEAPATPAPPIRSGPRWPLRYKPGQNDSSMTLDPQMVSPAPLAMPAGPSTSLPRFDEQVRMAILETLRFAQLTDNEYHALYGTFTRLPLPVFDLLISLFGQYFLPNFPALHLPTWNPRKCPSQLLLIMLGIGSVYAPIEGALAMGRVIVEIARRAVEHLINGDNRLARSLPIAQAQMLWSTARWIGSPRAEEVSEVFRGVHTTMLRRLGVFEDEFVPLDPSQTLQQQWQNWILEEERRRTAMTCFLLDGEICTFLHLPPQLTSIDMATHLPCPEELWSAPTAEVWLELYKTYTPVKISVASQLLSTDSSLPLPQSLALSSLGARVLIATLQLNLYHARQLHKAGVVSASDLVSAQVRRSLGRLARGDEFSPRFGSSNDPHARDDPAQFSSSHQAYHLAQISTQIPLQELDAVAHRPGTHAMDATERWTHWMVANPERARLVGLHAGQLLRIIRDSPCHGTSEPSTLFYAGLVLHLYLASLAVSGAGPSLAPPFPLDGRLHEPHDVDTGSWLAFGGPTSLQGLPSPLSGEAAASKLLELVAARLVQSVWRIGHVFASTLMAMVD